MMDYAPFPEQQLIALAEWHEQMAAAAKLSSTRDSNTNAAKTCREAVAAHVAVRERCLIAETQYRVEVGKKDGKETPVKGLVQPGATS